MNQTKKSHQISFYLAITVNWYVPPYNNDTTALWWNSKKKKSLLYLAIQSFDAQIQSLHLSCVSICEKIQALEISWHFLDQATGHSTLNRVGARAGQSSPFSLADGDDDACAWNIRHLWCPQICSCRYRGIYVTQKADLTAKMAVCKQYIRVLPLLNGMAIGVHRNWSCFQLIKDRNNKPST